MLHLNSIDATVHELLKKLFSLPYLNSFALAGGTALALQLGHRRSIDIDLFAWENVNMQEISLQLEYDFPQIEIQKVSAVFIFAFINGVKCDFVHKVQPKLLPFVNEKGIRLFSVADIASLKLEAICGRGSKKDFYDLYVLLQQFSLQELLAFHQQKTGKNNEWMILKSLVYFEDAEAYEQPDLLMEFPNWTAIKKSLVKTVQSFKI